MAKLIYSDKEPTSGFWGRKKKTGSEVGTKELSGVRESIFIGLLVTGYTDLPKFTELYILKLCLAPNTDTV